MIATRPPGRRLRPHAGEVGGAVADVVERVDHQHDVHRFGQVRTAGRGLHGPQVGEPFLGGARLVRCATIAGSMSTANTVGFAADSASRVLK